MPAGYVVITPSSQRTFYFFPFRYVFLRDTNTQTLSVHSAGLGYPVSIDMDGTSIPASSLQLPLLMEGSAGVLWSRATTGRLLFSGAAGLRFGEFLHGQLNNEGVFIDIGAFIDLSLAYRHGLTRYGRASLGATLYPHLIQVNEAITPEGSGFSIDFCLAMGFGRN